MSAASATTALIRSQIAKAAAEYGHLRGAAVAVVTADLERFLAEVSA